MITAVVGLPRQGKTYALALLGLQAMARGRTVYSTFALKGAGQITYLPDVLSEEFAGSVLLVHEMAALFDNRAWQKLDNLATTALAQHGKGAIDLYYDALSLAMVDLRIRQVTEVAYRVERVGPAGTKYVGLPEEKTHFFSPPVGRLKHPLGFLWTKYGLKDAGILGDPVLQRLWKFRHFVPYRRVVSGAYSTTDKVIPGDLLADIEVLLETAHTRTVQATGPFQVENGVVVCRPSVPPLPDGALDGKRSKTKSLHGARLA